MPDLYAAADVCVSRAGAMTVAELLIGRGAGRVGAVPGSARRPPDAQRRGPGGGGERPCWFPTPSATATRLAPELDALLADPDGSRHGAAARGSHAPTRPPRWRSWSTPMPADARGDRPTCSIWRARRIHIVGIGGAGMSAIATVLAAMGHDVSGCDLKDSPVVERLGALGIDVAVGHGPTRWRGPRW